MAGWTNNQLANRQLGARHLVADSDGESLDRSLTDALAGFLDAGSASRREMSSRSMGELARPGSSSPHLVSSNCSQDLELSRVVELEIIPRLLLMHSPEPTRLRALTGSIALSTEHVPALAQLAVEGDPDSAHSYVRALLDGGVSREQVFLDLLAPCARRLGEMWEDDIYTFSQVTIGLWRLQRVLHEVGNRFTSLAPSAPDSYRALMAAVPGAQHNFGVVMAAEFFSQAGWDVDCESKASWAELRARLRAERFDMFGLSVSTSDSVPEVASAIVELRRVSRNRELFVMVGGPLASLEPDLDKLCGADAMACYALSAVETATRGVRQGAKRA